MKRVKEYLESMGWLLLPPNVLAYDKQQHGIVAVWWSVVIFFILSENYTSSLWSVFITFAVVSVISFGIEFYQKWFTKDRVFDVNDAFTMMNVSAIVLILFTIIQLFRGTFTI